MPYKGTVLLVVFGIILLVFGAAFFFAGIFITGIILILIGIILLFFGKLGISQFVSSYKMQKSLSNRSPYGKNINLPNSFQNSSNAQEFSAIPSSSSANIGNYFKQPGRIGKNSIIAYIIILLLVQSFIGVWYTYILLILLFFFYAKRSPTVYGTGRFKSQSYSGTEYQESDGLE